MVIKRLKFAFLKFVYSWKLRFGKSFWIFCRFFRYFHIVSFSFNFLSFYAFFSLRLLRLFYQLSSHLLLDPNQMIFPIFFSRFFIEISKIFMSTLFTMKSRSRTILSFMNFVILALRFYHSISHGTSQSYRSFFFGFLDFTFLKFA